MLATDQHELAYPGTGAPALGGGPRCAGSSSRCAPGEAAEALVVAARSCRTIGGVLRLVHMRTCDRHARRVGRFYTETADIAAVLDKALPAV